MNKIFKMILYKTFYKKLIKCMIRFKIQNQKLIIKIKILLIIKQIQINNKIKIYF